MVFQDRKNGPAKDAKAKTNGGRSKSTTGTASPAVLLEAKRPPQRPAGGRKVKEHRAESPAVRVISTLLTAALLVIAAIGLGGVFVWGQFDGPGPLEAARGFVVPKGAGRLDIAARLEKDGIISSRWIFTLGRMMSASVGSQKTGEMKAGTYEFKKSASMREVADVLVEGRTATAKITIPEGLTTQQIVERLKANEALTGDITQMPTEGSLLPDTYVFTRGITRQELIDRMQAEQAKVLASAWEKRSPNVPFQTMKQALVMASIIEKETGKADEREKVAAVFVNRLRKNMRLQSDPTIIYGIVGGQGPLGRSITRADIDQKTAYNTYQIDGLPPTPIANPGRAAIEATLNPAQTNDIYFVADGSGGHTFSETLKDHNAAVANWRRIEREAKAAKEAAAASAAVPVQPVKVNGKAPAAAASAKAPDPLPAQAAEGEDAPAASAAQPVDPATMPLPVRKPKR